MKRKGRGRRKSGVQFKMNVRPCRKAKQKVLDSINFVKRRRQQVLLDTSLQDCVICLEKVKIRGILSVCDHWFCFICIYEWSKNTNTCPLCKSRFRCITKSSNERFGTPERVFRIKDKDQSIITYHEDDYEVAMGLRDESSSDTEVEYSHDERDETFLPSSGTSLVANVFGRRRRRQPRRNLARDAYSPLRQITSESNSTSITTTPFASPSITTPSFTTTTSLITADDKNSPTTSVPHKESSRSLDVKKRKRKKSIRYKGPRTRKPKPVPVASSGWIDMSRKVVNTSEKKKVFGKVLKRKSSCSTSFSSSDDDDDDDDACKSDEVNSSSDDNSEQYVSRRSEYRRTAKVKGLQKIKQNNIDSSPDRMNAISSRLRKRRENTRERTPQKSKLYNLKTFLELGSSSEECTDMICEDETLSSHSKTPYPTSPILFSTGGPSVDFKAQTSDDDSDVKTHTFDTRLLNNGNNLSLLSEVSPCILSQRSPLITSSRDLQVCCWKFKDVSNKENNISDVSPSTSKNKIYQSKKNNVFASLDIDTPFKRSFKQRDVTSDDKLKNSAVRWRSNRHASEVSLDNEAASPKKNKNFKRFYWKC